MARSRDVGLVVGVLIFCSCLTVVGLVVALATVGTLLREVAK